jgi:hypothetical protein
MPTVYQLAGDIWLALDAPDHHTLAKELARRADEIDDPETALRVFAYHYARNPRSWPRDGAAAGAARRPADGAAAGQVNSARSARVALVRQTWPALRVRYAVSPTERRALLDCDAADLTYVIANLETVARRTAARAQLLARLAADLRDHSVTYVYELPPDVLDSYAEHFR